MKSVVILIILSLSVGCIEQASTPSPVTPIAKVNSLEQLAFESFQARDKLRAEKLRELKGTQYDLKRQQAIESAGAEASRESWAPVANALAERLDKLPQTDQAAFDAVLEELARGAERAAK